MARWYAPPPRGFWCCFVRETEVFPSQLKFPPYIVRVCYENNPQKGGAYDARACA